MKIKADATHISCAYVFVFIALFCCSYFRLTGVDFFYTSTRVTDENGMTCFHYKHHGEIEVTSQCSDRVRMTRGKGRSSVCPAHFNTQLIIT